MKTHIQIAIVALMLSVSTLSCSLFDSGTEWKDGPYALLWIDIPADVTLSYSNNQRAWSPLVEKQVFAVGSDSRYIVAKQHPDGDRSKTNFYVVDRSRGEFHSVRGPMSEVEFTKITVQLGLPPFTKTLRSLE